MADRIGEAKTLGQRIRHLMENELRVGADEGCFGCQFEFDGDGWKGCNQHPPGYLDDARKGDYAYVGAEYGGALVAGKPARILFVSMDRNRRVLRNGQRDTAHLTFDEVQQGYHDGALTPGNNPHMDGVDCELAFLLAADVRPEARCRQFALVNAVLCGPPAPNTRSRATPVMQSNCRRHGQRIIRELEPDIIVAQGRKHPTNLCMSFKPEIVCDKWEGRGSPTVARGPIGGKTVWFVITSHPGWYRGFAPKARRSDFRHVDDLPEELTEAFAFVRDRYS